MMVVGVFVGVSVVGGMVERGLEMCFWGERNEQESF
jgi:hypothetical protein